jgi:hypothetical protein
MGEIESLTKKQGVLDTLFGRDRGGHEQGVKILLESLLAKPRHYGRIDSSAKANNNLFKASLG